MNQYYYMDESLTAQGPVDVMELAAHGVTSATLVWKDGMADWVPAHTLSDVKEALDSYVQPKPQPEIGPMPMQTVYPPSAPPAPMQGSMVSPPPPSDYNQKQNTNMNPQQYPGQPPAYSGYPYQQRPKRGVNTVLVAIICVLVTLLLAGVVWFFFGRGDSNHAAQPAERHRDTVIVREKETVIERQVPGEATTTTTRVVPSNPTQLKVTGTNVCLRLSPNIPSGPDKYSNCLKYTNGTNVHPSKGQVLPYHGQSGDFYQTQFGGYIVYISKDYSMPM